MKNKINEIRTVDPKTGGQKGIKLARFDLIPALALWEVVELYGRGADKYAAHNWRRGYSWSKSIAALERHLALFKEGEDSDPEMQVSHIACVVFHGLALLTFQKEHPELDDRWSTLKKLLKQNHETQKTETSKLRTTSRSGHKISRKSHRRSR